MNEKLAAQHDVLEKNDMVQSQLRAQVSQLRDEVSDRNKIIVQLEDEIEELVSVGFVGSCLSSMVLVAELARFSLGLVSTFHGVGCRCKSVCRGKGQCLGFLYN